MPGPFGKWSWSHSRWQDFDSLGIVAIASAAIARQIAGDDRCTGSDITSGGLSEAAHFGTAALLTRAASR